MSSVGIEVNPKKIETIENWLRPLTPIDLRSFLCLARYYRRFVEGFTCIASPLMPLTPKKVNFEWSEACEGGFQELKENAFLCSGI